MKKFFSWVYRAKNKLYRFFARLKTIFWYKLFFGRIGHKSIFYTPILLTRPENVFLGDRVFVRTGSRIETICIDYKNIPKITIGGGTSIEQRLHMTCAERIKIGREVVILADVLITDIDHDYKEIEESVAISPIITQPVKIGDYCFIGMGAKIFPGTVLGNGCVVGANSIVRGTFPDNCVLVGAPAKIIKQYDTDLGIWCTVPIGQDKKS